MSADLELDARVGQFLARCPECGAQAIGDETFTPGHMHDMNTEEPRFVQYEHVEEPKRRGRPPKVTNPDKMED